MAGKAIHPTQLYSAIANFIIFLFMRKLLQRRLRAGHVFYAFLITYGFWRFAIDYLRYYEDVMYVGSAGAGITWNQVASVVIIAIGTILLVRSRRHGESLSIS
jgi:phosphatidylglycerol:prolipoprotein diacylglycerol transferase